MKRSAIGFALMGLVFAGLALLIIFAGAIDLSGRSAPMSGEVLPAFFITLESHPAIFLVVVGFLSLISLYLFWGAWQQWRRQTESEDGDDQS